MTPAVPPERSGAGRNRGSLVRAAARRLVGGPAHTLELARDVLGLSGHPGAAAAGVFQILSSDRRFEVDGEGVWRLARDAEPLGRPLTELRFAVVDVETTGGSPDRGHRIIDIGIVEVTGGRITSEYRTMVNPGRAVPAGIEALTGISSAMVREAPYFDHVADEVAARIEGRVFVAHNVRFDWSFVSRALEDALGGAPDPPRLCTVRLARRLVPELRRRNLDELCRHFDVAIHDRHRAYGDALATARVLLRLLDEAAGLGIEDLVALEGYLSARGRRRPRRHDPRQLELDDS